MAAVQAQPVYMDSMATARKAVDLIEECASLGAWLAVFPEAFLPGNPEFIDRSAPVDDAFLVFEKAFLNAAIHVPGPETELIGQACARYEMTTAIGVTERPGHSGTLYNTLLYFGSDGSIVGRHRKLMPTYNERLIWGMGDGSTLRTIETAQGRVGGLICYENYMPLARMTLYSQAELVHVAPTLNPGTEGWISSMRGIANEGRMWVVSVGGYMTADVISPELMKLGLYETNEVVNPGGSVIVDPKANVVAGPVYGKETVLTAEVDASVALNGKRMFDVVGHYGRPDLFNLKIRGSDVPLEVQDGVGIEGLPDSIWAVPQLDT